MEEKTNKKRRFPIWLIVLLVIILIIIGVASASGFVPVLSSVIGANSPRNLGIKTTSADFKKTLESIGFSLDDGAGFGPDTHITYGSQIKKVDGVFSNEQISSLINFNHADKYPIRNAQIKISKDGTLEASAKVKVQNFKGYSVDNAVYVKGRIEVIGSKQIKINPEKIEIGRLPVPVNQNVVKLIEDEANKKINSIPGLSIQSVSYEEGKVNFKGTIPASAKRVKNQSF